MVRPEEPLRLSDASEGRTETDADGLIPTTYGTPSRMTQDNHMAHVAQLVEHVLGKDEVTRSIRVVGSMPQCPSAAWLQPSEWMALAGHLLIVLAKELRHGEGEI